MVTEIWSPEERTNRGHGLESLKTWRGKGEGEGRGEEERSVRKGTGKGRGRWRSS
jgi:hypothetical protein